MPAPTLDKVPGQPRSLPSRQGRRARVLLVATALVVASATGVALALASRPLDRQAPPQQGFTAAGSTPAQSQSPAPQAPSKPQPSQESTAAGPAGNTPEAAVLADGHHDAYITKVGADRIVVDVVQVLKDDAAVEAAVEDGESRETARYRSVYVRNQNPRLRTLPLAGDLRIDLRDVCDEPRPGRDALLAKLAANARLGGTYYYTLTVSDGVVERIQERLAVNAC